MSEMIESSRSLSDIGDMLKRRRWQFIVPALLIFLITAVVVVLLPSTYRSHATILIEQQEIPQDLVRSTVTSYADKRVQTISQRAMTTANLGKIIEKYDLYKDERKRYTIVTVVEKMRQDISLEMLSADVVDPRTGRPVSATIAFTLAYLNESPSNAQKVVNELASLFLNENAKERRARAKEATVFLADESKKLESSITSLEAEIEVFKESHSDSLPGMKDVNLQFLQRAEQELLNNDQIKRALDERIIYLEAEIAQIDPYSNLYSETGQRVLSTPDRLKALESEYLSLSARYSQQHPDVIAMKQELEALRRENNGSGESRADLNRLLTDLESELVSLSERYGKDHPDILSKQREITEVKNRLSEKSNSVAQVSKNPDADNPAYIQLQAQLQAARAERSSLLRSRARLQNKIKDLEQRILKSPKVEREYRALVRDYEMASLKFSEIKAKQLEAQLAEALETEKKSERFALIEPPLLPEEPDSPNRIALLILGALVSLVAGGGYVALRESLDDAVHSMKDITVLLGTAPLAAIATIETAEEKLGSRRKVLIMAFLLVMLLAGAVLSVHLLYQPLDVLSIKAMRRFGF